MFSQFKRPSTLTVSRLTHLGLEGLKSSGHGGFVTGIRAAWLYFANPIMTYSSDGAVPIRHYGPLVAFLLSLIIWLLARLLMMSETIKRHALKFVIRRARDPLEILLYEAQRYQRFIMVTLKSRKIYAGWVETGIDPMREKKAIKILPVWSGYRGGEDLQAQLITDYGPLIYAIKRWSPFSYQQFLDDLKDDPSSEEVKSFVEWVGPGFDPDAFDLRVTNAALLRLAGGSTER